MKHLLILALLLTTSITFAQRDKAYVDMAVAKFTMSLMDREINSFFYTTRYCEGNIEMVSMPNGRMCSSNGTFYNVYIFWQEEGINYGKKVDNCGMFTSVELSNDTALAYFMSNASEIEQNPVKRYSIEKKEGGPIQRTEINNCHKEFFFVKNKEPFTQSFKPFDLTNDAKEKNINYEYNQGLALVQLDGILDTAISEINNHTNLVRLE